MYGDIAEYYIVYMLSYWNIGDTWNIKVINIVVEDLAGTDSFEAGAVVLNRYCGLWRINTDITQLKAFTAVLVLLKEN